MTNLENDPKYAQFYVDHNVMFVKGNVYTRPQTSDAVMTLWDAGYRPCDDSGHWEPPPFYHSLLSEHKA